MKQPRLDPRDALVRPASRTLLDFLFRNEAPVRVKSAREELKLSVAQIGLAMRNLERHGLALRRGMVAQDDERRRFDVYIEATELGREHAKTIGRLNDAVAPSAPS